MFTGKQVGSSVLLMRKSSMLVILNNYFCSCSIYTSTQFKVCNYIVKPHVSKVIGAALERLEV